MSDVLLPIRLCSPTVTELKHRRVLGGLPGDVVEGSDTSDSESDDSADNEYAEGLGFADRRYRNAPASNFEFDNHPREEYFEEPKSWEGDVGRCVIQPTRDSKRPISAVLRELEAQEEREQKRPRLRGQAAQGAPQIMQSGGGNGEVIAQVRAYGACLALLRQRLDKEGSNQSWTVEALRVLKALSKFKIGVFELQSSGIGRELSKSAWQKNRSRDISRSVRRLLRHWRRNVGLPSGRAERAHQ